MIITLDKILQTMGTFKPSVMERNTLSEDMWSMDDMIEAITKVGKTIDPRFVIDSDNEQVYRNLVYWVMNDSRMKAINPITGRQIPGRLDRGIYLAGPTGTGKTVAMYILTRMYNTFNPFKLGDSKVTLYTRRADELTDMYSRTGDLGIWLTSELLYINDLGCEPTETLYMGNRSNVMKHVIEYRGDYPGLVTLITSNIPLAHQDLAARYGERTRSRLIEMTNYLELKGQDRRMKI